MQFNLADLYFSQRKLTRVSQVPFLLSLANADIPFKTKILIEIDLEDDAVILNGHHRCAALYLAGRKHLTFGEFVVKYTQEGRRTHRKFKKLPEYIKVNFLKVCDHDWHNYRPIYNTTKMAKSQVFFADPESDNFLVGWERRCSKCNQIEVFRNNKNEKNVS
jgi:hypothetical protein